VTVDSGRKRHKLISMRAIVFLFIVTTLLGCATQRAVLVNSQGEELTCEASGWGFIGSLATVHKQDECVANAEKRGYRLREPKS
jgi:hypothetical protein